MQYALNDEGNKISAYPNGWAVCPNCKSTVISKCGIHNDWHWAHESLVSCDNWIYEPKTKWHLNWQEHFDMECVEVFIRNHQECHIAEY